MAKPGADDDGSLRPLRTRRGDDAAPRRRVR